MTALDAQWAKAVLEGLGCSVARAQDGVLIRGPSGTVGKALRSWSEGKLDLKCDELGPPVVENRMPGIAAATAQLDRDTGACYVTLVFSADEADVADDA